MKPTFTLLEVDQLRVHEEIDPAQVRALARRLAEEGRVAEPIWVARGSRVILNGHHRFAALQALGARKVPVWLVEYNSPEVTLDRWGPGPSITKTEVVDRALAGRPFPPKTTRHAIHPNPGPHPTTLEELGVGNNGGPGPAPRETHSARPRPSRGGAGSSETG